MKKMFGRHFGFSDSMKSLCFMSFVLFFPFVATFEPVYQLTPAAKSVFSAARPSYTNRKVLRKPLKLRGMQENENEVTREQKIIPPFDLAALAGGGPENFVPSDFLALHEMILGATAKDPSTASVQMTSIGSALAEEMQRAYTNRYPRRPATPQRASGQPNTPERPPPPPPAAPAPFRGHSSTRGSSRRRARRRRSAGSVPRPSAACPTTRPSCRRPAPLPSSPVAPCRFPHPHHRRRRRRDSGVERRRGCC